LPTFEEMVAGGTCAEYDWSAPRLDEATTPLAPVTLYGEAKASLFRLLDRAGPHDGNDGAWRTGLGVAGEHRVDAVFEGDGCDRLRHGMQSSQAARPCKAEALPWSEHRRNARMQRRFVTIEKGVGPQGRIAVVRFDRGDNINALSQQAMRELRDVPRDVVARDDDADALTSVQLGHLRSRRCGRSGDILPQ